MISWHRGATLTPFVGSVTATIVIPHFVRDDVRVRVCGCDSSDVSMCRPCRGFFPFCRYFPSAYALGYVVSSLRDLNRE